MPVPAHLLPVLIAAPLAAQVAGTWNLVSQPDLPALIEQATATMKPAERDPARQALLAYNTAWRRIVIAHAGGQFTFRWDQDPPQRLRDDGLAVPWTGPDGRSNLVSARMEGRNLVHTLMGEVGMRKSVFRAKDDVLTLKVTVKAMRLPRPLTYTLVYRPL